MNSETGGYFHPMSGFSSSNQQFARHTADPGAGGAVGSAFDQDDTVSMLPCRTEGRKSGRTGTDDGNINFRRYWIQHGWFLSNSIHGHGLSILLSAPFILSLEALFDKPFLIGNRKPGG